LPNSQKARAEAHSNNMVMSTRPPRVDVTDEAAVTIVIELCQEVANETGQPCGTAEIVSTISPREQKQLVLLLIEEVIGVGRLKEDIADKGPKKHTKVR